MNLIDRLIYIKLCWNEINGHLSMPIVIGQMIINGGVFVKVWNIQGLWMISAIGAASVLLLVYLGHLSLKKGITKRQIALSNTYNDFSDKFDKIIKMLEAKK